LLDSTDATRDVFRRLRGRDRNCNLAQSEHFSLNAEQAQAKAVRFLADLVRIDTQDPPGSESEVAHYLEGVLKREGIESEIHHSIHGRVSMPYSKSTWSRIFQGSLRREALPNRRFYVLGKIPWGT